jgi:hypothetical protein
MVELCRSQLYRCYVIWGRQKKVLILPGGLIISTVGESPTTPLYTTAVMVRFPSLDSYRWSDIDLVGNTSAVAGHHLSWPPLQMWYWLHSRASDVSLVNLSPQAVDPPAGRIWMKRCEAVYIGADLLKNRYNTAIAIMSVRNGAR